MQSLKGFRLMFLGVLLITMPLLVSYAYNPVNGATMRGDFTQEALLSLILVLGFLVSLYGIVISLKEKR